MQKRAEVRLDDARGEGCALTVESQQLQDSKSGFSMLICVALIVITLGVYLQVGGHGFLNYDDPDYITDNAHVTTGLSARNVGWALTAVEAANWHPLTWVSHMTDVQLFGLNPGAHHLTSLFFHIVATIVLFLFLSRITGCLWRSSFVAALFALHPLHVESVAWVSERKDVLSAFFCFLTLSLYTRYVESKNPFLYLLALGSFALGLMSKPMLVTLPALMLLLDFWPLDRYKEKEPLPSIAASMKEKTPFFACSLFSAWITMYAQQQGGALRSLGGGNLLFRFENAVVSYARYIGKMIWPQNLAIPYPLPPYIPTLQLVCSLLLLAAVSVAVLLLLKRQPYLAVGWFWFLITLIPVIGIIQVGNQAIADRYTYIPLVGLFIMAAWGVPALVSSMPYRESVLSVTAALVVAASAVLTWNQVHYWRNDASLFGHAVQVTESNHIAYSYLGLDRAKRGDMDGAIKELQTSLRIYPKDFEVRNLLGQVLNMKGRVNEAIRQYEIALALRPDYPEAQYNLKEALKKAQGTL